MQGCGPGFGFGVEVHDFGLKFKVHGLGCRGPCTDFLGRYRAIQGALRLRVSGLGLWISRFVAGVPGLEGVGCGEGSPNQSQRVPALPGPNLGFRVWGTYLRSKGASITNLGLKHILHIATWTFWECNLGVIRAN